MLADGHGHQLYDAELQRQYQARYSGRVGTLYIHPPLEALLYLAVAWLPLGSAYRLWFFLNLIFLGFGMRQLAEDALAPWDWRLLLAASLTFVPALLCLQQGQDSILLLFLVIFGFTAWRRRHAFAAGCWLGLGLFKFQIVLPLVLVLFLTQSKNATNRIAKGFGLVALAFAVLSAAISGWSVLIIYPNFLLHLQAQPFAGIIPVAMANFRGLIYFLIRSDHSFWAAAAVAVVSAAALLKALAIWKHARAASDHSPAFSSGDGFDPAFANTVLFALLVSYHLNPHDLSLLLLPIPVLLHHMLAQKTKSSVEKWVALGLLGILFLPPLHVGMLKMGIYSPVGIPLLALFLTISFLAQPRTS